MPTGYTSKLHDGEQSFEAFVWGCARAFGALVLMRDDNSDAPITEDRLTDNYHERRVGECEAELAEWNTTTEEARCALFDSWLTSEKSNRVASEAKRVAMKARYQATLDKARAWDPPSAEHVEFRKFMIEQLTKSIDFDCSIYDPGPLPSFGEWCATRSASLARSIEYSRDGMAKERERNESRLAWVRALKASVPMPIAQAEATK
jgi:hypothetical protein